MKPTTEAADNLRAWKTCEACGERIVRHRDETRGVWAEAAHDWQLRRTCCRSCAMVARHRRNLPAHPAASRKSDRAADAPASARTGEGKRTWRALWAMVDYHPQLGMAIGRVVLGEPDTHETTSRRAPGRR